MVDDPALCRGRAPLPYVRIVEAGAVLPVHVSRMTAGRPIEHAIISRILVKFTLMG